MRMPRLTEEWRRTHSPCLHSPPPDHRIHLGPLLSLTSPASARISHPAQGRSARSFSSRDAAMVLLEKRSM